jgi:hypothetical protein
LEVKPLDLKTAARVSGSIKDTTSSGARRNYWNSVHRLTVVGNRLQLRTNDGSVWLDWNIPVEGNAENWDVLLPAAQFNEMASKSNEGGMYNIKKENGLIHLTQGGQRNLRLREETMQQYPEPSPGTDPKTWEVAAEPLARALRFVQPFIDATNPTPAKSVATLFDSGLLVGGSPKKFAWVEGLKADKPLSFKSKTAKAIADFLRHLTDTVRITIDSLHYTFECPHHGHKLVVSGENVTFPNMMRNIKGMEAEIFKVDSKMLQSGVAILSALLPAEADRLNLEIKGSGDNASLRLSTLGDDSHNSNDEFTVLRTLFTGPQADGEERPKWEPTAENPEPPTTYLAVNCRNLLEVLNQMEGTTLTARWFDNLKLLYLEDEKTEETDIVKSILLTAQNLSNMNAADRLALQAQELENAKKAAAEAKIKEEADKAAKAAEKAAKKEPKKDGEPETSEVPEVATV